ncbi:MAG: formate dehydrogenase accessory protein FdhE [Acidobacteriota bacterium]
MSSGRKGSRLDPPEIAELRALAAEHPELATATALHIDLLDALRRVQGRVATASVALAGDAIAERLAAGRPLVTFDDIAIDWTDARLLFRQVSDILRRHDAVDADTAAALQELARSAELPALARRWFHDGTTEAHVDMLDEALGWALRPFLVRVADVLQSKLLAQPWTRGVCPVCGGEPAFACITTAGQRLLICQRCSTQWPTSPWGCPFCGEADKHRITSLATPDGRYRVAACRSCLRYLKALDRRKAHRAAMPVVDAIATLPLDAVIIQRGFSNG